MRWTVFERGWLSSNSIFFLGKRGTALVDTGYCTHADQTLALVDGALQARALDVIVNTHLHSDHCGGNAALQAKYPHVQTYIPSGQAEHVQTWNPEALSYTPTGQQCPQFLYQQALKAGDEIDLGDTQWQIHASPGHDSHSIILFESQSQTLISADALWQNGFGVVFPELEGEQAFQAVAQTLNLIENLHPQTVIPGHGSVFAGDAIAMALATARNRLDSFVRSPRKHTRYAMKVLLKYKLLELQSIQESDFIAWASATPYFERVRKQWFADTPLKVWVKGYIDELVASGAARHENGLIVNL